MFTLPTRRSTLFSSPTTTRDTRSKTSNIMLRLTNTATSDTMPYENFTACPPGERKTVLLKRSISKGYESEFNIYKELLQNTPNQLEDYTAPLWLQKIWRTPDGLCDPLVSHEYDPRLERFYDALQHTLYETGYPETIDMTSVTKQVSPDQVTIGILSSPVECMSALMAGGEQCPGDMLLILSHTWCSKERSSSMANKYSLYVHQAVAFHKGGYSFLERYNPPRRVTYFVNFFNDACTGGVCSEGGEIEKGLDCPMSSSLKLNQIVDDKLYTRLVLGKVGVAYPTTLAFPYKVTEVYENGDLNITIVPVGAAVTDPALKNLVKNEVGKFVARNKDASFKQLVVKPSGASWFGSKFVSFHDKMDVEGIAAAVENIIDHLGEGDCALVEEYISFESPQHQQQHGDKKYNVRIRSTVCRTSSGKPRTTKITCGIGYSEEPINGDNTIPHSLEYSLKKYGFSDVQIRDIRKDIELQSEKTMAGIMESENDFSEEKRGEVGAQTDVIGIDLILKNEGEKYEVVVIEVNSHDCMINCQVYEFINPNTQHEAATDLVETMIARSNAFLVKGKTLLIIGVGCYSKWFVFEEANRLGINVVLVDTELDESMPKVHHFIQHDMTNLRNIEQISADIIRKVHSKQIRLDGCVSFWEDFMPIAAAICEDLGLVGSNFRAAMIVKNKYLTHQTLEKRQGDIPHFPRTHLYTSKTRQIDSREDIREAVSENSISLPAVLKLLYGSSAVGVHLVKNEEECLHHFDEIQQNLDIYGVGLGFGTSMMLTDYIVGSEHDVDLIIFKRKLIAAFVSDNGPTRLPAFVETASAMPSVLDEEGKNQLITAAYQCCLDAGLENGAFNVELMMTMLGPKLLEINGRMGGFYLRDWIKQCFGVDILLATFLIALGIRPIIRKRPATKSLVGVMCLPSEHMHLVSDKDIARQLHEKHDNGSIRYNKFEKEPRCERFESAFANIAASGPDTSTAKKALIDLCTTFQISTPTYDIEKMLSFVPF